MKSINKLTQCAITFATLLPLATLAPDAQANLLQTGDFELGHDVLLSSGPVTDSHLIPNWTFSDYGVQAFAQITTSFLTCLRCSRSTERKAARARSWRTLELMPA